jgi:hypothetical protein
MDYSYIFAILLLIYLVPAFVATGRHHPNAAAIFLLDLFLGWTLIGWVVALVWSATHITKPQVEG